MNQMDRRKDHDTRRRLNHALLVKHYAGVNLAAVYCHFIGVRLEDAARVLPRRNTLIGSAR